MKEKFEELNMKVVSLMQECRDFEKKVIKSGKTAFPYEVWVNVMSEENGFEPKRVGLVSVEKMDPYEYPFYIYMDTNGYEYKSEDLSPEAHWEVVNAYMNVMKGRIDWDAVLDNLYDHLRDLQRMERQCDPEDEKNNPYMWDIFLFQEIIGCIERNQCKEAYQLIKEEFDEGYFDDFLL